MNIKIGNLYQIVNGYFSDLPDEKVVPGGAWATDLQGRGYFLQEETPILIIEKDLDSINRWKCLVVNKLFFIEEYYLKEL